MLNGLQADEVSGALEALIALLILVSLWLQWSGKPFLRLSDAIIGTSARENIAP